MLDDIKISIIIPVYNVEQYLEQCLNSIVSQTYQNFEVICINDGSTDNSLKILEKYAKQDDRFKIYFQENQGQGVARNNALKIAKGEYIVFIYPDDWIEPNMLEELQKAFELTKAEVIHFNYREYYEYSRKFKERNTAKVVKKRFNYDLKCVPYYNRENVKKGCLWNVELHAWARAYSREFLERIQAVFAPTKHSEDHLFANIVLLNAEKIYYLDRYLYTYRCREHSITNSISNINFCIFENIQLLKTYLIEHNLYERLEDEFRQYQFMVMMWHYKCIPAASLERYKSLCLYLLSEKEYKKWLQEVQHERSFLENIFSLKNERTLGIKYKVVTVLGLRFSLNKDWGGIMKILKNARSKHIHKISLLGFPIYLVKYRNTCRTQNILGKFIYTKKLKSGRKEFKILNVPVFERILENDIYSYFFGRHLIKQISLDHLFYNKYFKYFKKLKFDYDDVYVLNTNSGEVYLFCAYIAKAFLRKNKSLNPLFVATKKYHIDILKLYLPDVKHIYIPNFKLKIKDCYWKYHGHRFFIIFKGSHCAQIEKLIKNKEIGSVHYLKSALDALELSEQDFLPPDIVIAQSTIDKLSCKISKVGLKLDNFVILAPEALTCEEISKSFWQNLAEELQNRDFDVYLNITNKKNYIRNCISLDLSYSEVYCLATKARAVISLRSGLSEFLLPAEIPNIAIYTKFRHPSYTFPVDKGIAGFSMLKIPFVKKENIRELNYDKFINEKELLDRVLNELESFRVFDTKEKAGCS